MAALFPPIEAPRKMTPFLLRVKGGSRGVAGGWLGGKGGKGHDWMFLFEGVSLPGCPKILRVQCRSRREHATIRLLGGKGVAEICTTACRPFNAFQTIAWGVPARRDHASLHKLRRFSGRAEKAEFFDQYFCQSCKYK